MALASRIIAAAGLLAVPALLAVGSQALSRPADIPLVEPQTIVVDLAPAGTAESGEAESGAAEQDATIEPSPSDAPGDSPVAPPASALSAPPSPQPARPLTPAPAPIPAPFPVPAPAPADQGTPGVVEREVFDDDADDDGQDDALDGGSLDDDAGVPDGEDD